MGGPIDGQELGTAVEVTLIKPTEVEESVVRHTSVLAVQAPAGHQPKLQDVDCHQKIRDLMESADIAEPEKSELSRLLEDHNTAFC